MFNTLISICWLIFFLVWLITALGARKNIPAKSQKIGSFARLVMTTVIVSLAFNITGLRRLVNYHVFPAVPFVQYLGVFICALGIAFAIWARIHLGKNWGMPMALKDQPDLVRTGPYRLIRHPIYTGIAVAMLGSMITVGFTWLVWLMLSGVYFIYSAKKEEKVLLLQFPGEYSEYMHQTKMFIPYIF